MSSLDRYSTLKHSKVKEQREKQMWGNSYTQEDEEEAGSPLLAHAAPVTPWGCVPLLAPTQLRVWMGYGTVPSGRGKKEDGEALNVWNKMLQPRKPLGARIWTEVDIQMTDSWVLFSKAMVLSKAFLPACNKWYGVQKIQDCTSLLM